MLHKITNSKYSYSYGSNKRDRLLSRVKSVLIFVTGIAIISLFWIYSSIPSTGTEDDDGNFWLTAMKSSTKGTWMSQFLYHQTISKMPTFQNRSILGKLKVSSCKIPQLDPFEPTIISTVFSDADKDWKITCGKSRIFWTDQDWNLIQNRSARAKQISCCYRVMYPQEIPSPESYSNNFSYKHVDPTLLATYTSTCVEIISNITKIRKNYEFISIECYKKDDKTGDRVSNSTNNTVTKYPLKNETIGIVYRDMFAFVPLKTKKHGGYISKTSNDSVQPLLESNMNITTTGSVMKPNILIIGLDQVSHMQFIRHFPKSYEYLKTKLRAKAMMGYNKVADTTLPNVVPLLTGLHLDELSQSCWNHSFLSFFDTCPFIWKNFSSMGYFTSYAEDKMPFSTFYNKLYARRGFRYQPTDYFYNFLGMQIYTQIKSRLYCTNNRLQYEDMLDYVQKTAASLKNHSYFQFVWASSLFTKEFNLARNGDQPLVSTLMSLENDLLQNTILFILSDHGYRFSPLMELKQGRAESRLPLFFATFPKWLTQKFPKAIKNFETNTNRLTTAFDAFETLQDLLNPHVNLDDQHLNLRMTNLQNRIIKVNNNTNNKSTTKFDLPRGISMFLPIPFERTCDSAGIEENFCTCDETKILKFFDKSEIISKFQTKILAEINDIISNSTDCMKLKLVKNFRSVAKVVITNAYRNTAASTNPSANPKNRSGDHQHFILQENIPGHFGKVVNPRLGQLITSGGNFSQVLVTLQTIPGLGIFEGRLKLEGKRWNVKDVLRLNSYNDESHCVYMYKLKSFCYCNKQKLRYLN